MLEVKTGHTSLHITLTGKGVSPMIQINMPMQDGVLDMGAVLAGEYLERTFKVSCNHGNYTQTTEASQQYL